MRTLTELFLLMRTMITQPLYHIIDTFRYKMLWQTHGWYMDIPQAIRFMAFGAIKMYVQVIDPTVAFVSADSIFQRTGTVVYTVYEVMFQKEIDGARQGGFIHRIQICLQVEQTESTVELHHGTEYE